MTWQLHADPIMWVAGVRALYLQALHPRAVRASCRTRSSARTRGPAVPHRGLRGHQHLRLARRGRADRQSAQRIHSHLTAVDPETGEQYRIDETALLRWIHCAAIVSYADVARRAASR
ncbi:oxygenase MpaB family protein [Yinghuangia aomiensis]